MNTAERITVEEMMSNRRKLSAALRSGGYPQGRGMLRNHAGAYCCLGVGCRAVCEIQLESQSDGEADYRAIALACGFTIFDRDALIRANDTLKMSFPEIADLIDAMPVPAVEEL